MNDMTISQASTVLGEIVEQATGQAVIAPINTPGDFVSVAQTALKTGLDPVLNAISQVWSKTIFAYRPSTIENRSLEMDIGRWGNAVRKISPIARKMDNDAGYEYPVTYDAVGHASNPLGNGLNVDHYTIQKQESLQTNFYGSAVYQQRYTVFKDQFESAFTSPAEFAQFNAMNIGERANDLIRYKSAVGRGLQLNYIGAILDEKKSERVVHLLREYNAETGLTLTAQTIYQPENFAPFMRWVWARIKTIIRYMGVDSEMYQTVINSKHVLRHTSPANMRVAMFAKAYDQIETMVMADTYHDNYLQGVTFEAVPYWQSIETPDSINVKPVYTDTTGAVKNAAEAVNQSGILAVLHDRDAIGYCFTNTESNTTPLNAKGRYWNTFVNARVKTISDMTEKGVVLLLD